MSSSNIMHISFLSTANSLRDCTFILWRNCVWRITFSPHQKSSCLLLCGKRKRLNCHSYLVLPSTPWVLRAFKLSTELPIYWMISHSTRRTSRFSCNQAIIWWVFIYDLSPRRASGSTPGTWGATASCPMQSGTSNPQSAFLISCTSATTSMQSRHL